MNTAPALVLNHVAVFVDQSQVTSPSSLQLQLLFKSNSDEQPLTNVNIALAVSPRDFDFDYLAPASSSEINPSDPLNDCISLSILLKKHPKPAKNASIDLLDFSGMSDEPLVQDWNKECFLKIKVNYQVEDKNLQQIGQLPSLLL